MLSSIQQQERNKGENSPEEEELVRNWKRPELNSILFFKFAMGKALLESLAAEATALADGDDTELSMEERARKALECDCVAELREGPCGIQFSEAFYCFLTSEAQDQGSDCIKPFVAMQTCMTANPEAFVQSTGEDRKESSGPGESPEVEKDVHQFQLLQQELSEIPFRSHTQM